MISGLFPMWYARNMPVVLIVVVAIVAFVAVNAATLVLLGSTRARREALTSRHDASSRRFGMKTR